MCASQNGIFGRRLRSIFITYFWGCSSVVRQLYLRKRLRLALKKGLKLVETAKEVLMSKLILEIDDATPTGAGLGAC